MYKHNWDIAVTCQNRTLHSTLVIHLASRVFSQNCTLLIVVEFNEILL